MAVTTKWICPSCTYYNYPSTAHCTICSYVKPTDLYPTPRLSTVGPRQKKFHLGGGGVSRGPLSSALSGNITSSGAGISSDMIIDPDNAFTRYRPSSVPLGQQREGGGRGRVKGEQSSSTGAQSKWVCSTCTYGNWPNSKHCTMCNALKGRYKPTLLGAGKDSSGRVVSGGGGGGASVGIGESILDYAPSLGAVGGGAHIHLQDDVRLPSQQQQQHQQQQQVRDSPSNRPAKSKTGKKSSAENRAQKKWKCAKCTFENWARAGKCVICQTSKNKTPSPPISDSESSQSSPNPAKPPHSRRLSPSSSSSPTENANSSPSSLHTRSLGVNSNEPAASSVLTDTTPSAVRLIPGDSAEIYPSTNLKSTSDEVRQIRNRLSSSDWLFINACLGVVNEDEAAVKAYLRHEGDRARQLSRDDCLMLGQPSTFSVGSTLVHLAIR